MCKKNPASCFHLYHSLILYLLFMYYYDDFFGHSFSGHSFLCHLCTHIIALAAVFVHPETLTRDVENLCTGILDNISSSDCLYVCYGHIFSKINQNRSFCSAECDSQSVSSSSPWAGQLSLFFKLKHDLLRILTCDKLYTLLITCQLER